MADEFVQTGRRLGVQRVAVLPFSSTGGRYSAEGENVAERLAARLRRSGAVAIVGRSAADVVITGSIAVAEGRLEVHARMTASGDSEVLHASDAQVEPEWAWSVEVPDFFVPVPALETPPPIVFRDIVAGETFF